MAGKGNDESENDLSALLDSALDDFGRVRNTDDELDSMMDTIDEEDAKKAAQKFAETLKTYREGVNTRQEPGSSGSAPMTADERKAAENFQKMVKALVVAEQKALNDHPAEENPGDRAVAEAFIDKLNKLAEQDPTNITDESQYETLMSLVQTFFAKDVMYPPLKQLMEKFPKYMEEHSELDAETKARYEKQMDALRRICAEYEKCDTDDVEEMKRQFDSISTMMMELQSYGYPPEELVGEAPPGWVTDPETGLPKVDEISKAAEACSLM